MGYGKSIVEKGLPPAATYFALLEALYAQHFPTTESDPDTYWRRVYSLSPGERAFILTNEMCGEVGNGGFGQYFDNTGWQRARDCVHAFRLIGASKNAAFLLSAVEIARIPGSLTPDYYYIADSDIREALNILDKEYYRDSDDIEALMVEHVRRYPDQFR